MVDNNIASAYELCLRDIDSVPVLFNCSGIYISCVAFRFGGTPSSYAIPLGILHLVVGKQTLCKSTLC